MVIGVTRIAHCPAERDHLGKPPSKRLRHACERSDGNERIGKALRNATQMNIAGKHHVTGTHPPVRCLDPLAHARRIYRDSLCVLEDTGTGALGCVGETKRVGQWIDLECIRKIDGLKIAAGSERIADPLRWPALNRHSHFLLEEPEAS